MSESFVSAARSGRVGVGIIGAGVISTQYLTNLTKFADLDVLFVADLDVERARAKAEEFGVPGSGTVAELLAVDAIEIVINLTIPAVHVEVGEQIIAAGKHQWSEKPLALDRESGRRLLESATAAGLRVSCAPDTILGAGLQTAQRLLLEGRIGTPLNGLVLLQGPGPESWHPSPEFLFDVGAGPLFDIGPYYLTALVQLLGPIARVSATSSTARTTRVIGSGPKAGTEFPVNVPTHHGALIEFAGGAAAQTTFSFESVRKRTLIEVAGTTGTLEVPNPNTFDDSGHLWLPGADEAEEVPAVGSTYGRGSGALELARAIRAGVPERASGELAFHVLDAMISIAESALWHKPVELASSAAAPAPLPADWDPAAATL
ncbi:Gfo/Idh/MocA family oxidoreductase [Occultella glacieicola]|uniref:Gfo/Idh/MocA family oxidoreductase n=1 Tax=Occultella glacieicola TaxID=2518684 RepID=A0ABY2E5V8_9MICO|nr:Gfo/Idh/MocA family oxidoreductase [Occultella glacieicola]TDE91603.1 Gfo/Idh/MocA family oxidoreductase [Occultella glacieicola]